MFTVVFKNVGRRKESWSVQCEEITYDFMFREVKKHGIMSDFIEFLGGVIYAGVHAVGPRA